MVVVALAGLAMTPVARAKVQTKEIEYRQGETPLKGFLAYDDAVEGKRPGVLVIHEWWGLNQFARDQAVRLAQAGYVAFAADMYGSGKQAQHPEDAQKFMQEANKDPATLEARFDAAEALLKSQPQVDGSRIAAIGFCFGGGVALSMARAGKDLVAVGTFHAAIPKPAAIKNPVKSSILIQTGGSDPMVAPGDMKKFAKDLEAAGAKVEVVVFPAAKHSFTVPDADKAGMGALHYDADAARKSWANLLEFFKQTLKA
jgi:dienelactone hydrolase